MSVGVGDRAPDFTLPGTGGVSYSLSDFLGKPIVLVFYPGDDSVVCTKQLNAYNEGLSQFRHLDAQIVGISAQDISSKESFSAKHGFEFPLLADVDKEVAAAYGTLGPIGFPRRSTFIIDASGTIRYAHRAIAGLTYRPVSELIEELNALDEVEPSSESAVDVQLPIDVIDHPEAVRPASPSATIVLVRDGDAELEVLMIHRGAETAFGGMWAFPGGVIELDDIPDGTAPDPLPAARRAAARETQEEVGLAVDESALVHWSHWLPPVDTPRRFSTWFFVAPAGDTHADEYVGIDGEEVHAHRWIAPANALAKQASGEMLIAPPTYVTLEQIHRYGDVASVLAAADPASFVTEVAWAPDGARICLWEGDAGYGFGDPMVQGPRRRLVMDEHAGWRYLNTVG